MSPVKERSEQPQSEDIVATRFTGVLNMNCTTRAATPWLLAAAGGGTGDVIFKKRKRGEPAPGLEALQQTVEIVGIRTPFSSTRRQGLKLAQVQSYEPALKLLAELYDKVTLPVASLRTDENGSMAIAVGMLAAAGLCDVDPGAVRLSPEGKDFVEFLTDDDNVTLPEA